VRIQKLPAPLPTRAAVRAPRGSSSSRGDARNGGRAVEGGEPAGLFERAWVSFFLVRLFRSHFAVTEPCAVTTGSVNSRKVPSFLSFLQ